MNDSILAGIVTFNPNIQRLHENINFAVNQVKRVVIVDNGSNNINNIEKLVDNYSNIELLKLDENKGIAYALKQIMIYAIKNKYDWVLSLDQDSVCDNNLINIYKDNMQLPSVGMLTCNIVDRNFKEIQTVGGSPR